MLSPSDVAFTLDPELPVLTHARSMQAETNVVPHAHPRGQLLWAMRGMLRVTSEQAVWVVPSTHGVWIPGHCYHQVSCETLVETRNLYIDPSYPVRLHNKQVVMVSMSPLMREVVLRLNDYVSSTEAMQHHNMARIKRLGLVAIDELEQLSSADFSLPSGSDPRLQRIIRVMVNQPEVNHTLSKLSLQSGASVRTLERLFKNETGLTFRQWRTRFKLMNALDALNLGQSTTLVAHALGYRSASSFIAAFKAQFGYTPQAHVERLSHP